MAEQKDTGISDPLAAPRTQKLPGRPGRPKGSGNKIKRLKDRPLNPNAIMPAIIPGVNGIVDPLEKKKVLAGLHKNVKRLQVQDKDGSRRWRDVENLVASDIILLTLDGKPFTMNTKPGRPKKPLHTPGDPVVEEIMEMREKHIEDDPVFTQVREDAESPDVLQEVMAQLAKEAASLGFERHEAERKGKDTGIISGRRVIALKAVGDTWLKRKEQVALKGLDLDTPAFQAVFKFILETFREAMGNAGLRPEMAETVFNKFSQSVTDEWKAEAAERVKKSV